MLLWLQKQETHGFHLRTAHADDSSSTVLLQNESESAVYQGGSTRVAEAIDDAGYCTEGPSGLQRDEASEEYVEVQAQGIWDDAIWQQMLEEFTMIPEEAQFSW